MESARLAEVVKVNWEFSRSTGTLRPGPQLLSALVQSATLTFWPLGLPLGAERDSRRRGCGRLSPGQLPRNFIEEVVDVCCRPGGCLHEEEPVFVRIRLRLVRVNLALLRLLLRDISLVARQSHD